MATDVVSPALVVGKVVQIAGPAVDCEFPEGQIPEVHTAIRIISEKVDDSLSASGQGLYSACIMGLGMGIFVLAAGPLSARLGTGAFFVMSLVALAGTGAMAAARGLNMARITAAPAALPTGQVALTLGT